MILLDTHVLLWLSGDSERLSSVATSAIREARSAGESLAISCVTLFEAAQVVSRGRAQLTDSLEVFLHEVERRFVVRPISAAIASATTQFDDRYPKDPMDRIIGATALVEGMTLVTADDRIRRAGVVKTLW
jgi:PIN domain nuclease of toxin-antitoxin system